MELPRDSFRYAPRSQTELSRAVRELSLALFEHSISVFKLIHVNLHSHVPQVSRSLSSAAAMMFLKMLFECDAASKIKQAALDTRYIKAKASEVKDLNLIRILRGACKASAFMTAALAGDNIDAAEAQYGELKAFEERLQSVNAKVYANS